MDFSRQFTSVSTMGYNKVRILETINTRKVLLLFCGFGMWV